MIRKTLCFNAINYIGESNNFYSAPGPHNKYSFIYSPHFIQTDKYLYIKLKVTMYTYIICILT